MNESATTRASIAKGPRLLAFLAVWALIVVVSRLIIQSSTFSTHAEMLSLAITIDTVVLVPVLYWLLIRGTGISPLTVIPVLLLSFLVANLVLPAENKGCLEIGELLLIPVELFAIGLVVTKVRSVGNAYKKVAGGSPDFLCNLRQALYASLGRNRAAEMLATEIAMFYYAFAGWRSPVEKGHAKTFTCHLDCGYSTVMGVFLFLIVVEVGGLHLILLNYSVVAAWILTALGIYGLLFLLADLNAVKKRPVLIEDDILCINVGFRWTASIPLDNIREAQQGRIAEGDTDTLKLVLLGDENVLLELTEPVEVKGLYGITRRTSRLALQLDDPAEFVKALKADQ